MIVAESCNKKKRVMLVNISVPKKEISKKIKNKVLKIATFND